MKANSELRIPPHSSHTELYNSQRASLPVRLLIFLAAPHKGLDIDALQAIIKTAPPQHLIFEYGKGSSVLKDMHDRFRDVSNGIPILCVFETLETKTVVFDVRVAW
jgi:hypothetical protein